MKYKVGDVVQIVKVNDPDTLGKDAGNDNLYLCQIVKIININYSTEYCYEVKYSDDFKGDKGNTLWAEDELDYPCDSISEKLIWDKLRIIADDIKNLKDIPECKELRDIYYMIRNYNGGK